MTILADYDTQPWYRQFWPWFLIALPGSVVIAGIFMIFIAFKHADSTVNDEYYKDGLAINQLLAQDRHATELQLIAQLDWDGVTGEVLLNLTSQLEGHTLQYPQQVRLFLQHPTEKAKDKNIILDRVAPGRYRADLIAFARHRYYLRLLPIPAEAWRLQGVINLAETDQLTMRYQ